MTCFQCGQAAAGAGRSLQSCPTLHDPIEGSLGTLNKLLHSTTQYSLPYLIAGGHWKQSCPFHPQAGGLTPKIPSVKGKTGPNASDKVQTPLPPSVITDSRKGARQSPGS